MKALLTALDVDYQQWRALTRAALKMDARTTRYARGRRKPSNSNLIVSQALFYGAIGAAMSFVVWFIGSVFVAGLMLFSYVILMVGTAMLADHNSVIVSPSDYMILGFRPVSSRTYFAAKLTNVLVYTLATSGAAGLLPVIILTIKHGAAVGAAAIVALFVCATTVTLAIVVVYASLVRLVGARRLRNVVSYAQMIASFVMYSGYFLVSSTAAGALSAISIDPSPWLLLYPGTWFVSYLELAAGNTGPGVIVPVLASLLLLGILARQMRGRLTLDYAEKLGALSAAGSDAESRTALKPGRWFRSGEGRAVAILVRSQFRNDRFRMGVLSIIPMTLLYLFMGLRRNGGAGASNGAPGSGLGMVTLAVLMFPVILQGTLGRSESFRAPGSSLPVRPVARA